MNNKNLSDLFEQLGKLADQADNYYHGPEGPRINATVVKCLKEGMKGMRDKLKELCESYNEDDRTSDKVKEQIASDTSNRSDWANLDCPFCEQKNMDRDSLAIHLDIFCPNFRSLYKSMRKDMTEETLIKLTSIMQIPEDWVGNDYGDWQTSMRKILKDFIDGPENINRN